MDIRFLSRCVSAPRRFLVTVLVVSTVAWCFPASSEADAAPTNLVGNPSFEGPWPEGGLPDQWSLYGGQGPNRSVTRVDLQQGAAVHINDSDGSKEVGITQRCDVPESKAFVASVRVKAVEGVSPAGAYLQVRCLPSNEFAQRPLIPAPGGQFDENKVGVVAPAGTKQVQIYLYTHSAPAPQVIVDDVALYAVEELPAGLAAPGQVTVPEIASLKDLHLDTALVRDGKPAVAIVRPDSGVYDEQAKKLQEAFGRLTGVSPEIRVDTQVSVEPPTENLILLGNRSTNQCISALYERYYTLLDLRYPGPNGYVVRSLHNPFGNGRNILFVGGSDLNGVDAATDVFIEKLSTASGPAQGEVSIGRLMEIRLGDGIETPDPLVAFQTWEDSANYGSVGYFGWNSISKRMAMYYMTGDAFHAREAIRLAFPDDQAKQEISDIDGERIENKDTPLSGPYHYNAHMMILYWDLIEESPVFTDEERLRVTNAFAHQLDHPGIRAAYRGPYAATPAGVGSRHGQWTAISLYCLGRYFAKDYDDAIWPICEQNGALHFKSLHSHAWVTGENDNLFWYDTAIAPIFTYLLLSGDRVPLENGVIDQLLRGQEMLISGRTPDWALQYASLGYLHKVAYLTGDGRWLEYRRRTGVDVDGFRLGQSYWPDENLRPALPTDMVGDWKVNPLPEPLWKTRHSGFPLDESYLFMSYRSETDASGDFILLDGFNGESRNPYHTFAVLELRTAGTTLLEGYLNQLLTRMDGMVEPEIAKDAALRHKNVLGDTAIAVGEVPDAAYANWRRAVIQRIGKHTIIVDSLTPRGDSENFEVQILWQAKNGEWKQEGPSRVRLLGGYDASALPEGWLDFSAVKAVCRSNPSGPVHLATLAGFGVMLLRATEPGHWIEMPFETEGPIEGETFVDLLNYKDRGVVRILLDGDVVVDRYDHHAPTAQSVRVPIGTHRLEPGRHTLRLEVVDGHDTSNSGFVALGGIRFKQEGAGDPPEAVVCTSRPCDISQGRGAQVTMEWLGPVHEGQPTRFVSVVAEQPHGEPSAIDAVAISDAAAAVALPEPGLVVCGEHAGTVADTAVMTGAHVYALGAMALASLLKSDQPVEVDWDLDGGQLALEAPERAQVQVRCGDPDALQLDGQKAASGTAAQGWTTVAVPSGRHLVTGAVLPDDVRASYAAELATGLKTGRERRDQAQSAREAAALSPTPALEPSAQANVGGEVVYMDLVQDGAKATVYAVEGTTVHVLDGGLKPVRTLETDGTVRMVRWWPEHRLLLAGCADEKVIAFDENGNRAWEFVSEMHPDVFRAAKTYWFKSAPGHEGIHGLYTGVFLDGKSQAFVGSACTLEILDENGQLVERLPQFWGKVSTFRIIDGPGDSLDLLAARKYNGTHRVGVINNKTVNPDVRRFNSVPKGYTFVGGWSSMNRHHLFYEDFDGDGENEVMSEINGTWNRVTVWNRDGTAEYDASFGPGDRIPALNMRDIDTVDLTGDSTPDIVVATARKMLIALSGKCEKIWARRLESPPVVMDCVTTEGQPRIVVGCEDGSVLVFDREGQQRYASKAGGKPTSIGELQDGEKVAIVIANAEGGVVCIDLPRGR